MRRDAYKQAQVKAVALDARLRRMARIFEISFVLMGAGVILSELAKFF